MKKIVLIAIALTSILFCCSSFKFGFERIQTISVAIKILGNNKTNMDNYLSKLGFAQKSEYKSIIEYKKSTSLANYSYSVAYKNEKADAVSWSEVNVFANEIVDELLINKFERFSINPKTNIYGYRNIKLNILVTLIINNYANQVIVSMGPLNPQRPVKKKYSNG